MLRYKQLLFLAKKLPPLHEVSLPSGSKQSRILNDRSERISAGEQGKNRTRKKYVKALTAAQVPGCTSQVTREIAPEIISLTVLCRCGFLSR